jgi:hypothetical protein
MTFMKTICLNPFENVINLSITRYDKKTTYQQLFVYVCIYVCIFACSCCTLCLSWINKIFESVKHVCTCIIKSDIVIWHTTAYEIYIFQVIRYSRVCGSHQDFLDRGILPTNTLLNQGFILVKSKSSLRKLRSPTWAKVRTSWQIPAHKLEVFIWRHVVNVQQHFSELICAIFRPGICKNNTIYNIEFKNYKY